MSLFVQIKTSVNRLENLNIFALNLNGKCTFGVIVMIQPPGRPSNRRLRSPRWISLVDIRLNIRSIPNTTPLFSDVDNKGGVVNEGDFVEILINILDVDKNVVF